MNNTKNYEVFTWGLCAMLYPASFILSIVKGCTLDNTQLMASAIGASIIPLVLFLIVKIFATVAKNKTNIIAPRWIDLLIIYVVGFVIALPALFFSTRTYWIAVSLLSILAIVYVLLKRCNSREALIREIKTHS